MRKRLILAVTLSTAAALLAPAGVAAQDEYPLQASVLYGAGGSVDEDQSGLGNAGYQLGLALVVSHRTKVGVRVGELSYDATDRVGRVRDPEFSYITVAGEYSFSERYYESGIYLGLGSYRLDGRDLLGRFDDSTIGLVLGVTGEFEITRRLWVLVEAAGHFADFEVARYFATFHGGLSYHF